ncbi:MAG: response regulator transcription factor [Burkholderiaceae bacterium]|nr:response regulator transcription factor [Burkholderiaceae bacterium]
MSSIVVPARLLLIDDHELVRLGMIAVLTDLAAAEGSASDVLEARTLAEALDQYGAWRDSIFLVLLDLHLPDAHGLLGLSRFLARYPGAPVAVVSAHNDPALMQQALAAGALAYFTKGGDQLARLISFVNHRRQQHCAGGSVALPPAPARAPTAEDRLIETLDGQRVRLTSRQAKLLDHILVGLSNRDIAAHLHLAEGTVKNQVSELLGRFHVSSRAQLISRLR